MWPREFRHHRHSGVEPPFRLGEAQPLHRVHENFARGRHHAEQGELRFTQLGRQVDGISQKMLTQTLRQMERDGLVVRTVHPVIPHRMDYRLTDLGLSLGEAFCGVWYWAMANFERIGASRSAFDARVGNPPRKSD